MFSFFKSVSVAVLFIILSLSCFVFAQDTNSVGILQSEYYKILKDIPFLRDLSGDIAGVIYFLLIGFVYRATQEILKKLPTRWGVRGPNVFWKIAVRFFGKSIIYYNTLVKSFDPAERDAIRSKIIEDVNSHFEKHNVLKKS
ncbi:MAG: hypothetical protein JW915_23665 [Chitinispirillaceae bacterium]|nr:hypothetical protein [Chitinispirillaceae bacterium]